MILLITAFSIDSLAQKWVRIADSVLHIRIEGSRVRVEEENQLYSKIFNIYLPPVQGGFMNETHLRKISNYLIKEQHMYSQPVKIGKFFYIKFSGLWDSLLIKDGSIRLKGDTLYVRFHVPRDLDYIRFAVWNILLVKGRFTGMSAGVGFENAQYEIRKDKGEIYRVEMPVVLRKDIPFDRFKKLILDTYSSLSDSTLNDSTFLGINLGGKIFRYAMVGIEPGMEENIYRYGRIRIVAIR